MILNKPSTISKNVEYNLTLTKSEILLLPKVANHLYFIDPANWKEIDVTYKTVAGNQYESVIFPVTAGEIQSGEFFVSSKSRGDLTFLKMTIHDFDGGSLPIFRSEIPSPETFDIPIEALPSDLHDPYISNINQDAVIVGSLIADDPLTQIGQSFQIPAIKNVRFIETRAKKVSGAVGSVIMKIYRSSTNTLIATSTNSFDVSTLSTSEFSTMTFNFDNLLQIDFYYFRITLLSGSLPENVNFAGTTNNSDTSGSLFASDTEWAEHDLDYRMLTGAAEVVVLGYIRDFMSPNSLQSSESFSTGGGVGYFDVKGMNLEANNNGVGSFMSYSQDITSQSYFTNGGVGDYRLTLDYEVIAPYVGGSTDFRIQLGAGFISMAVPNPLIISTGVKQFVHTFTGINPLGNAGFGSGLFILYINSTFGQHFAFSSFKVEKL